MYKSSFLCQWPLAPIIHGCHRFWVIIEGLQTFSIMAVFIMKNDACLHWLSLHVNHQLLTSDGCTFLRWKSAFLMSFLVSILLYTFEINSLHCLNTFYIFFLECTRCTVYKVLENLEKSWDFENEFQGPGKVLGFCKSWKSFEIVTSPYSIYFHYSYRARSSFVTQHVAFVHNKNGRKRGK